VEATERGSPVVSGLVGSGYIEATIAEVSTGNGNSLGAGSRDLAGTAVILPLKDFKAAKRRLSRAMSPTQREALAHEMARRVVHACRPMEVWVVSGSKAVEGWARQMGCRFVPGPDDDLDTAVTLGLRAVELAGFRRAMVVHGDLPYARTLVHVATLGDVVLVTDSKGQGTNVLSTPVPCPVSPSYGEGSLQRHAAMVRAAGMKLHVVYDPALSRDLDDPEDLLRLSLARQPFG